MTIDEFQRAIDGIAEKTLFLLPTNYHYIPITLITVKNNKIILAHSDDRRATVTLHDFLAICSNLNSQTQIYFQIENNSPQPMFGFKQIPNAIVPH